MLEKVLRMLFSPQPQRLLQTIWRRVPVGSFKLRLDFDVVNRPPYAYCVYQAALLARRLGIPRISVVEFGVAGGQGLIALERIVKEVRSELNVEIDIYGFDAGSGLPEPVDHRDLPSCWKRGFFRMNADELRRRLDTARLVLGDVAHTVPAFFREHSPAPIGAALVDLDFYSSTVNALKLFDADHQNLLPRVFCYFDDIMSTDVKIMSEYVGELLAIKEFNECHDTRKIAPVHGLRFSRQIAACWNEQVYVFHDFEHPMYNTYVHPDSDQQLPIA